MSYVETLPPPLLRPFVDRFWARTDVGEPRRERPHRILPDGCIDVIIDLAHGRAEVVGTMTRAIVVPVHHSACLVAVRFKPGAAVPFLEVAARELTDRKIPVAELGRNALDLRHAAGRSPGEALAILENALLRRLPSVHSPDPMVARAIALLFKPSPHSIGALARELGRSRQHIGRMFLQHVGIGPKELARIARLQRAIAYLQRCRSQSSADAAARLGYFDQAHMARDFRLLAGATPRVVHAGAGSIFPIQSLFGDADFGA